MILQMGGHGQQQACVRFCIVMGADTKLWPGGSDALPALLILFPHPSLQTAGGWALGSNCPD